MALDTQEKRMNAARVARPWMRARLAVGATDQQSRIASGHGYGGNALSAGSLTLLDFERGMCRGIAIGIARGMG